MHIGMWAQPQADQMTGRKEVVGWWGEKCELGEQKGGFIVLCNHGSGEREREATFFLEDSTVSPDLGPDIPPCWPCPHPAALLHPSNKSIGDTVRYGRSDSP